MPSLFVRGAACAAALSATLLTAPAFAHMTLAHVTFAHVTLAQGEAPSGASCRAVLKVPHDCGTDTTTAIRVEIPDGGRNVTPQPEAGWTLATAWMELQAAGAPKPAHPAPALKLAAAQPAPAAQAAATAETRIGDLVITRPWSRATPGGAKVAGGFVTITNTGKTADRLVGGTFDAAGRFEVHEMAMNNGVMTMRPVTAGLEIAPGGTVTLAPGGYHIMFMDLKRPLADGESVNGTLVFEKAGRVEVSFTVRGIGAGAPAPVGGTPTGSVPMGGMSHQH